MSKYLVQCECGNQLSVDLGQAGGTVACRCGRSVDVPTLRILRHAPVAEDTKPARPAGRWSARHGIATVCFLVLAIMLGFIAWSRFTQPSVPKFDPDRYQRDVVEPRLAKMTPTTAFEFWVQYYRPMAETGLPVFENINRNRIEHEITHRHFVRAILWIIAGLATIFLAAAIFSKRTGVISGGWK